jgi:superfamily II DNA/RNA helicase
MARSDAARQHHQDATRAGSLRGLWRVRPLQRSKRAFRRWSGSRPLRRAPPSATTKPGRPRSNDSRPNSPDTTGGFESLGLAPELLRALADVGYESPSPIQAATIPPLLSGRDLLGQAQTGTGKTAAFALPILARIDTNNGLPQALVLTPTRELAIQVAEAFQKYATHLPGFHVLPVYGGQAYGGQLHALKRGVHVVVGTPGRIIDHLERGSLDLSQLKHLVLDEADEMLRMGFIDDVEKILQKTPAQRQTCLFSATMPAQIKRIAQTYLRDPAEITIAAKTRTADNIRQRYWLVSGLHKLDALTRILEAETFDGMIIFARTKQATEELAEKLSARGFAASAINGDIAQPLREKAVQKLKDGQLDILVATDVAARGLDVERISHVVNYDIPYDTESYVHRIGRTGRAGRTGDAILFVRRASAACCARSNAPRASPWSRWASPQTSSWPTGAPSACASPSSAASRTATSPITAPPSRGSSTSWGWTPSTSPRRWPTSPPASSRWSSTAPSPTRSATAPTRPPSPRPSTGPRGCRPSPRPSPCRAPSRRPTATRCRRRSRRTRRPAPPSWPPRSRWPSSRLGPRPSSRPRSRPPRRRRWPSTPRSRRRRRPRPRPRPTLWSRPPPRPPSPPRKPRPRPRPRPPPRTRPPRRSP